MKKFGIIILIAVIHFVLSVSIIAVTASIGSTLPPGQAQPSLGLKTLVLATKILHFPIISQAFFSRQWFPGSWIYIPMLVNSLLWAVVIFGLLYIFRRLKKKKTDGKRKH
jgi:uncharacterized membrane protein